MTTDTNQSSEDELREKIEQYLESTYQDGAVMATRPNSGYHKRVDEFTDKLLALILKDRQAWGEYVKKITLKKERDRSFAEYQKMKEFYSGGEAKLKELLFPDHCSSCHAEWDDNGFEDMPCCSKAPSNIRAAVEKWHEAQTKEMYDQIRELTKSQERSE